MGSFLVVLRLSLGVYLVDGEDQVVVDGEGVVLPGEHLLQAHVQARLDLLERLQHPHQVEGDETGPHSETVGSGYRLGIWLTSTTTSLVTSESRG